MLHDTRATAPGQKEGGTTKSTETAIHDPLPGWLTSLQLTADGTSFATYVGPAAVADEARSIVTRLRSGHRQQGLRPPRAVLISGPAGVGKTHLARVIASELASASPPVPVYEVNASELTVERLEELRSATAAASSHIVLVLDEVESLAETASMGFMGMAAPSGAVLPALLTALDGLRTIENICWIFATSKPDRLDPAFVRPGRIDVTIELDLPAEAERADLIRLFRRHTPVADDWSDDSAAAIVGLCTPAAIRGFIRDAHGHVRSRSAESVTLADLDAAVHRDGKRRVEPIRNQEAKWRVALHEAGHALVGTVLGEVPTQVRLDQESGSTSYEDRYRARRQAGIPDSTVRNWIAASLAGAVAEHLVLGEGSLGSEADLARASDMARARLRSGCDPRFLVAPERSAFGALDSPKQTAVQEVLREEWDRAMAILRELQPGLVHLASELLAAGQLSGQTLIAALDRAQLDPAERTPDVEAAA